MLSLQNFLIYTAAFYGNLGNYKSFGDTKFVPDLPKVQYYYFCTVICLELWKLFKGNLHYFNKYRLKCLKCTY